MAGITIDDCIEHFNLTAEVLDAKCSDKHIADVSRFLDWKGVARYLELTDSEVTAVDSDGRDEADKRHKCLEKWMSKFAFKATYRNLIQALLDSGKGDHAEEVCKLLQKDALGPQQAVTSGRFEERDATSFGEPQRKYRRVSQPEECQQDEQVQQLQLSLLCGERINEELIEQLQEREAQLQENEIEILQRNDELNMLQLQLSHNLQEFQAFQAKLGLPLRLSWKQCSDMPFAMHSNTHSVVLKGKVYLGGGGSSGDLCTVVVYDTQSGKWSTLSKCQVRSFGMAVVKNQLTLVGGFDLSTNKATSELAVWESESKQWASPYPPMHTARHDMGVATYNEWIAVAGGYGGDDYLNSVEILNTTEKQWYSAAPLPVECDRIKSAVIRDEWYIMEGRTKFEQMFAVSLPALILLRESTSSTPWRSLPSALLTCSAILGTHDSLFVVGGKTGTGECSSAIYLYLPWKKRWFKVGDLPTEQSSCTCTELPNGEILVAGGVSTELQQCGLVSVDSKRVDIATVINS